MKKYFQMNINDKCEMYQPKKSKKKRGNEKKNLTIQAFEHLKA